MKRIYHHYEKWEDYKNGLYEIKDFDDSYIEKCLSLLKNTEELYYYMKLVVDTWHNATEQQMTNSSRNKQAWLGQSACNIKYGVNEDFVKKIWRLLSNEDQIKANNVADNIINYYKNGKKISGN